MNNDHTLNLHSGTELSGWLRHWLRDGLEKVSIESGITNKEQNRLFWLTGGS